MLALVAATAQFPHLEVGDRVDEGWVEELLDAGDRHGEEDTPLSGRGPPTGALLLVVVFRRVADVFGQLARRLAQTFSLVVGAAHDFDARLSGGAFLIA